MHFLYHFHVYYLCFIGPFQGKTIWSVQLDPQYAGGPYTLNATLLKRTIALSDIMFGDVWLCSGQSNMEFTVPMVCNSTFTWLILENSLPVISLSKVY